MAIKASDQISVVDLTDGYSVMLTSDAASFAANASGKALAATTFVTQVIAMRGTEAIQPSITAADIVCPTNITASVSTSSPYSAMNPGISITVAAAFTGNNAEVTIPVNLENGITINKKFTISASKTGAAGTSYYTRGNDTDSFSFYHVYRYLCWNIFNSTVLRKFLYLEQVYRG